MSFQPFAVQCLTCGSNLRVTDPAIVGTIAACPKCNSMVQIERPGGSQLAVGRSGVDSQAITEEAIAVGEGASGPSGESTIAAPFAGSEGIDGGRTQPTTPASPSAWQSEHTRRSRQIALVVALSFSGLLSAAAVFGWFVHTWRGQDSRAEVASSDTISSEAGTPQVTPGSSTDASRSADPSERGEPSDGPLDSPVTPPVGDPEDSSAPPDASQSDDSGTGSDSRQSAVIDEATPARGMRADAIPTDLIPQSPIDALPRAQGTGDDQQIADDPTGGMQQLPPQLAKYTKFLLTEGAAEAPALRAPPTMDEIKIDAAAAPLDDPLAAPKPKVLNLKADLAIRLALASEGYAMSDLMLLVSQITGVPIQIDWVSFDLAGTDIDGQVPIQKGWRSAGDLLKETASSLGAEVREQKTLVVLTLSDVTFAATLEKITDLQDFGDARDSAADVLKEFLRGDEGQQAEPFRLGDSREEQQLAALAVESLRRMRGMEPKVAEHRLRRWARSAEDGSIDWPVLVGGDAGPRMDAPITLAGFLRRTSRRNQATCVVNWHDANHRGAAPQHLVMPHADVDAATTLGQLLSGFGLQVRQVDAQHWWVGSEATYDRLPVLLWTSPLGDSRDTFTRQITSIMSGASRETSRLAFDEASDRALLLLPRYIVRQLPRIAASIAAN